MSTGYRSSQNLCVKVTTLASLACCCRKYIVTYCRLHAHKPLHTVNLGHIAALLPQEIILANFFSQFIFAIT